MFTRYGLGRLWQQVNQRNDSNAMRSTCSEYNCDCHELVPRLLDDLIMLHGQIAKVQQAVAHLSVTLPKDYPKEETTDGDERADTPVGQQRATGERY